MQKILLLLNNHEKVVSFTHISPPTGNDIQLHDLSIHFIDESILYVKEIITPEERKYSYHWQDKNQKLITRWDTAPHHKYLDTFPHHKHDPDPAPSKEITLKDILDHIFNQLE